MKPLLSVISLSILMFSSMAFAGNKSYLTYQGRIIKPDGSPVNGASVSMTVQIVAPSGCLLWEQNVGPVDFSTSKGTFSVTVGNGPNTAAGGLTWDQIFQNGVALGGGALTGCGGTYTGSATDDRTLYAVFNDGSGNQTVGPVAIKTTTNNSMLAGFPFNGVPTNGQTIAFDDTNDYWYPYTPTGGGSLNSVALSAPAIFSLAGSPVTGAGGTITMSLANQTANTIFAGPSSGGPATPAFRALVAADLTPALPSQATHAGKYLQTDGAGNLSWQTSGGAGDITDVVAGTALTGGAASGSATLNVDVGLGASKIPQVGGSAISANSIILSNGTGNLTHQTLTNGQLLIGSTGFSPVAATLTGTANQVNISNGSGSITLSTPQDIHTGASPTFNALTLSTALPIASGGTGQTTATAAMNAIDPLTTKGDVLVHNGADSIRLPVGTDTWVLTADSTQASGVKWAAAASGADNLGNHTATTNLIMGSNWISGDGGNEGIRIDNSGNVGVGTSSPATTLHVAGTIRYVDGNQGAGKVLQSDASGNATWATLGGSESTAVSNVGAGGVGMYRDMTGSTINLKNINAASSAITVTNDAGNSEIDIGVNAELGGLSGLATTGFVKRTGVGAYSTASIDVTTDITGILPIANGGTNSNTALNNNRIMVSSAGKIVEASALTNGQLLIGSTGAAPVAAGITGTANQVTVTNGAGSITLSLPQDIATTSTPTFATPTVAGHAVIKSYADANVVGKSLAVPTALEDTKSIRWNNGGNTWEYYTPASGSGTVNSGTQNQMAWYSANGTAVSGLATANNGVLVTSGAGIPSIGTTLPNAVQDNITRLGTVTSGTWNATAVGPIYGGTGIATYTLGDTLYSSAANTIARLSGNTTTTKKFLTQTGTGAVSAAPAWGGLSSSDMPTYAVNSVMITNASGTLTAGGGTTANTILQGSVTGPAWSTATYPSTTTINQLLFSSAANTVSGLATANNGVLVTNGSGVPSWLAAGTNTHVLTMVAGAPTWQAPSGGGGALSAITAATATNSINNANYAQAWSWDTATTQNPMTLSANAITTGSILNITSSYASGNSTNGLLYVANTGAVTNGAIARIQSNSTTGSGLTVLASGNVGVGTATPAEKLHIHTVGAYTRVRVSSSNDNAHLIITGGTSGDGRILLGSAGIDNQSAINNGSTGLGFDAPFGSNRMFINSSSGNVGVGTTSPAFKLSLAGTATTSDRKIGINGTQVLYLPDNTSFSGSLFIGDGGGSISHASGFDGQYNTGVGRYSLFSNTTGHFNVAIGSQSLQNNNSGSENTAAGESALRDNTTGQGNTANGYAALRTNTTGSLNTAIGSQALRDSTGSENTAVGGEALYWTTTGTNNTANGVESLWMNKAKSESTAIGYKSMKYSDNTVTSSISYNTAIGAYSLYGSTTASANTGIKNTAAGHSALMNLTSGSGNIAIGYSAGSAITTGSNNVVIGSDTGSSIATSSNNVLINDGAGTRRITINSAGNVGIGTTSPSARLDVEDTGTTTSAIIVPRAGNFTGTNVNGMVRYNTTSNLFEFRQNGAWVNYTTVSDGRLKTNVVPVQQGLEIVNQLNPVFFDWDQSSPRTKSFGTQHQVGFIAQEVEKVLPEVVNKGEDSYRSVEYGKIVAVVVASVKELYGLILGLDRSVASVTTQLEQLKIENEKLKSESLAIKEENQRIRAWICSKELSSDICR